MSMASDGAYRKTQNLSEKGLLKLYYDPENAEALHVDTISLPTALPCLKAARHVNACKCHEMSKFKIHVLRK